MQVRLDGEAYTCLLSPDKKQLYISIWGEKRISVFNTETRMMGGMIKVGDHPNELCLNQKW
ncbi:MAG: hypothetical protein WDM90_17180 [Ferruginibacter sp.]